MLIDGLPAEYFDTATRNARLVREGRISRFSHVKPGTGKRGRPGVDRLNDLPAGDVLFIDELTGIAYQGRANLAGWEVGEHVNDSPSHLRAVA